MPNPTMTDWQPSILRNALAPYADKIGRICLFGSRTTGKSWPNSDIDLVLYGHLGEVDLNRLRRLFDESGLDVAINLVNYATLLHPPLGEHIDAVALSLFTQSNLKHKEN